MQVAIKTINAQGLEEIRAFLLSSHKHPEQYEGASHSTMDMLRAWAQEAEFQLSERNGAEIELKSRDSIHGRVQTFRISDAGLDVEYVEIDE